jgi:hypothetical protein
MPNTRNRYPGRRRFLKQSAALTASASLPVAVVAAVTPSQQPQPDRAAVPGENATREPTRRPRRGDDR